MREFAELDAVADRHFRVARPPLTSKRTVPASYGYRATDGAPCVLVYEPMAVIESPEYLESIAADMIEKARWLRAAQQSRET